MPHGDPATPKKKSSVIWSESWSSPQFSQAIDISTSIGHKGWQFTSMARATMRGRDDHPWLKNKKTTPERIDALIKWRGNKVGALPYLSGYVEFAGLPESVKVIRTKRGDKMAFVEVGDLYTRVEVTFFKDAWRQYGRPVSKGQVVQIGGFIETDADGHIKVIADYALPLDP